MEPLAPHELAQQDRLLTLCRNTLDKLLPEIRLKLASELSESEMLHWLAVEIGAVLDPDFQTMLLTWALYQLAKKETP